MSKVYHIHFSTIADADHAVIRLLSEKKIISAGKPWPVLFIEPTIRRARYLRDALAYTYQALWQPDITTLGNIVTTVITAVYPHRRRIDRRVSDLLLLNVFNALTEYTTQHFKILPDLNIFPGVRNNILDVFRDTAESGYASFKDFVTQNPTALPDTTAARTCINELLELEQELIELRNRSKFELIDDANRWTLAMAALRNKNAIQKRYAAVLPCLILDNIFFITPAAQTFLDAFTRLFEHVIIVRDIRHNDLPIFESFNTLTNRVSNATTPITVLPENPTGWENLYRIPHSTQPLQTPIRIYKDFNPAAEVKRIARTIHRMKRTESNFRYSDITIIVPRLNDYFPYFQELFPMYYIPYDIQKGHDLSSTPLIQNIRAVLELPRFGTWDRAALYTIGTVPFFDFSCFFGTPQEAVHWITENKNTISPHVHEHLSPEAITHAWNYYTHHESSNQFFIELDTFARHAGVTGGGNVSEHWLIPILHMLIHSIEDPGRFKYTPLQYSRAAVACYFLHVFMTSISERLYIGKRATITDRLNAVRVVLDDLNIQNRLSFNIDTITMPARNRSIIARRDLSAWNALQSMFTDLESIHRLVGKTNRYTYERFLLFLRQAIHDITFSVQQNEDQVTIMEPPEARGLSFKKTFIINLSADAFPGRSRSNSLFPSVSRLPFVPSIREQFHEKYLLYYIIQNSQSVILSYPEYTGTTPHTLSPYLDDVINYCRPAMKTPQLTFDIDHDDTTPYIPAELHRLIALHAHREPSIPLELRSIAPDEFTDALAQILMNTARLSTTRLSRYDGLLLTGPKPLQNQIASLLQKHKPHYSCSRLECYADHPLLYWLKYSLYLEEMPEVQEEPDSLTIGTIIHAILERFYIHRYEHCNGDFSALPIKINNDGSIRQHDIHELLNAADEVFRHVLNIDDMRNSNNMLHERLYRLITGGLQSPDEPPGYLRRFLDIESNRTLISGIPIACEHSFTDVPITNTVSIKGHIDRIDIRQNNDGTYDIIVFDYKTGKLPDFNDIKNGVKFQLPVYTLIIEKLLKNPDYDIFPTKPDQIPLLKRLPPTASSASLGLIIGAYYHITPQTAGYKYAWASDDALKTQLISITTRQAQNIVGSADDLDNKNTEIKQRIDLIHTLITRGVFPPLLRTDKNNRRNTFFTAVCRDNTRRLIRLSAYLQQHCPNDYYFKGSS